MQSISQNLVAEPGVDSFNHPSSSAEIDKDIEANNDPDHGQVGNWMNLAFRVVHILRHVLLLLGNIAGWYFTNGMNGIAMQKAALPVKTNEPPFVAVLAYTGFITAVQLLLGAAFGRFLLFLHSLIMQKKQTTFSLNLELSQPIKIILAGLHLIGSISTNLGFMFGSASLVQIIKLMEPFQTLILSKLFSEEGKHITPGIVTSMSVTVGAAISLIKSRPTKPPVLSVVFAILSGFTMCCRNVLQRQQFLSVKPGPNAPTKHTREDLSPLERALTQFIQMSLQSGLLMSFLLLPLLLLNPDQSLFIDGESLMKNGDVFLWHPLYNAFSMITLGFCSALTHSLLNAGKRVVAIAMAIIWFKEKFTVRNIVGLILTLVGGCWYTYESKNGGKSKDSWIKFLPTILILYFLFSPSLDSIINQS